MIQKLIDWRESVIRTAILALAGDRCVIINAEISGGNLTISRRSPILRNVKIRDAAIIGPVRSRKYLIRNKGGEQ